MPGPHSVDRKRQLKKSRVTFLPYSDTGRTSMNSEMHFLCSHMYANYPMFLKKGGFLSSRNSD